MIYQMEAYSILLASKVTVCIQKSGKNEMPPKVEVGIQQIDFNMNSYVFCRKLGFFKTKMRGRSLTQYKSHLKKLVKLYRIMVKTSV